jgi:hypothetical protein
VLSEQAPDLLNTLEQLQNTSARPTPGGRSATFHLSPGLVFGYSHQYSFGIERELPAALRLYIAYIGDRSFHLPTLGTYNRAQDVPGIVATTANLNQRRPDQRYFDVSFVESGGIAYYDAVQVGMTKRISRGLTFRAAYTFGKNIDLGSDFTDTGSGVETPPETGTPTCEICSRVSDTKGPSAFDTPQAFLVSYNYSLPSPATNGWASAVLGGWQISGTTVFQSGLPFHVHTGSDGPGFGNLDGTTNDRVNILNPAILGKSIDNPDTSQLIFQRQFFDTILPVGGRGDIGMNTFRKMGASNWNFALGRRFRLPGSGERSLQFRAESYNLLNRPQFDKPGYQFAADTFGKITNTTNKGRQIQFSLRLNF